MEGSGIEHELQRVAAAMDAEVRSEQAEYEALAVQSERRARTLADVAAELVVRGDRVEISVAGLVLDGTVRHSAADYLVLEATRGRIDLPLTAVTALRVTQQVRSGGTPPGAGAKSFQARLTEHETAGVVMTLLRADGEMVEGLIRAAARDHLLLQTRHGLVVLPTVQVAAVWPRPAG
ncbi:MAG: hypothetical protein ACR2HR_04355 [Euzebya sp.]